MEIKKDSTDKKILRKADVKKVSEYNNLFKITS